MDPAKAPRWSVSPLTCAILHAARDAFHTKQRFTQTRNTGINKYKNPISFFNKTNKNTCVPQATSRRHRPPLPHANTEWKCTKSDDNRCTNTAAPLLSEPLCYTVSYRYVSDHLYLGRLPAGRGVWSWRWMVSRHGARSPARRAPCRRSRTT